MQTPERLALIGGSILLASTLVFTLKSQASTIIPNVSHAISGVFDHIGDAQNDSEFGNGYREAQRNDWTTGMWGSAKYYINDKNVLHVSSGDLDNTLFNVIGAQSASSLKSVSFDQDTKAPLDCGGLLAQLPNVTHINGLNRMDITGTRNMAWMFSSDPSLESLDLGNWNTSKDTGYGATFDGDWNLSYIDISSFQDAWNMGGEFSNTNIRRMKVGPNTNLWGGQGVQGDNKWRASDGFVGDFPGGDHPGIWTAIK